MATTNNKIEIYPQNTRTIGCVITGLLDITGYTPYLTIKRKATDNDSILTNVGIVQDPSGTVLFTLTPADTSIVYGDYVYDVTIENGTAIYTVVKDKFIVIDSVRY